MGSRNTRHAPAKLPRTPRQVACSFVLNAVAGQFHDDGNKQQQLEAAEDKEAVVLGGADCLVVDLLQCLARVLLTPHFLRIHDDVVVLEKEFLKGFDVVAIAAPGIAGQEEFCPLLRPGHDWLEGLEVKFSELVSTQVDKVSTTLDQPRGLEALEGVEQVVRQVKACQLLIGRVLLTQCFQR